MEISIIGYPKSGKTTVFNGLTQGRAETAPYSTGTLRPNIGMAKVPDPRVDSLAEMYNPKKVTLAEVSYSDIPGMPEGFGASVGIHGELLNLLQRSDALIHVVRLFEDETIPFPKGAELPADSIPGMELELTAVDLGILERRLNRIQSMEKGAKPHERSLLREERAFLDRLKSGLDEDIPIRDQLLDSNELKLVRNYQFLTSKPMLIVLDMDEGSTEFLERNERKFQEEFGRPGVEILAISGKIEMELAELSEEDRLEFRDSLGLSGTGLDRVVDASYRLLELISFLTTGEDEVRAWSVPKFSPALECAGRIHSDIERGFIRAEVIGYQEFIDCGSMVEAKKKGLLRQEGKTYVMQDGDIVHFLFNV